MEVGLNKILSQIRYQEDKLSSQMMQTSEEAYQMTLFLKEMLCSIKTKVLRDGFKDDQQEIDFCGPRPFWGSPSQIPPEGTQLYIHDRVSELHSKLAFVLLIGNVWLLSSS